MAATDVSCPLRAWLPSPSCSTRRNMRVSHGLCLLICIIGTACSEPGGKIDTDPGIDREVTVEAALDVARPTLTIATYGDGSGSVAAGPTARCSGNCAVTVEQGAQVTLTAAPENGSEF